MKAILFGGAGFLGSSLNHTLKDNGITPIIVDNFSVGKKEFLNGFDYLEADILKKELIEKILSDYNPDLIIHLAAIHHIPTAESNPKETLRINLEGTCNILDIMEKHNFKGKFGFASTGGVYFDIGEEAISEEGRLDPIGVYTLSKYYCEKLIEYYMNTRGCKFDSTIFRLFNLVGKNETNDHLLPAILYQIKNKSDYINHGNLLPKRDYIHVDDASSLISNWAISKIEVPKYLNICSNKQYSVEEVINICFEVTNKKIPLKSDQNRIRKSDRLNQKGNNNLAKTTYRWEIQKSIKDGINDLWNDINQ